MSNADNQLEEIVDPTVVIGHSSFVESFTSSMASGRMHHAWLLTGPSGIGKAAVARLAAAWLLSEKVDTRDLLGAEIAGFSVSMEDPGAKLVFNGAHPDYLAKLPRYHRIESRNHHLSEHPFSFLLLMLTIPGPFLLFHVESLL